MDSGQNEELSVVGKENQSLTLLRPLRSFAFLSEKNFRMEGALKWNRFYLEILHAQERIGFSKVGKAESLSTHPRVKSMKK